MPHLRIRRPRPTAVALGLAATLALALIAGACADGADTAADPNFPPAPVAPDGDLSADVRADLDSYFASLTDEPDLDALARIGASGDPRLAWLLTDVLRFSGPDSPLHIGTVNAWETLTQTPIDGGRSDWGFATDHMIAWDLDAPPDYVRWKSQLFELLVAEWAPFFADPDATIDWRWVSWGGVGIDDRPMDQTDLSCTRSCIPALDDPGLVQAGTDADWLDDERLIFGVVVDGEAVAFPKNIMEVHEMVNITIGGRRLGIPYCTLCGSAQAYLTDDIPAEIDLGDETTFELRTSGLLIRSNKVMYEFHTKSVFDTFTGAAVTGPLRAAGVTLQQVSVVTSTWGAWKAQHPASYLVAEDGGIGSVYRDDPLRGRDDNGPIFPIGSVDDRLDVQQPVIGVIADDGSPLAFAVDAARAAADAGEEISMGEVSLRPVGDGFVAFDRDGTEIASHQAFWFAWSQFHPDTEIWTG